MRDFEISLDGMRQVSSLLRENMEKGLAKEGKDVMVKMLVTYVHALPDGSEKGDFLALDLGGSNFRVLLISTWLYRYFHYVANLTCTNRVLWSVVAILVTKQYV